MSVGSGRFGRTVVEAAAPGVEPTCVVEVMSVSEAAPPPGTVDAIFTGAPDRAEVLAALAWAVWHGARRVRTDDPEAAARVCRTVAAVIDARIRPDE